MSVCVWNYSIFCFFFSLFLERCACMRALYAFQWRVFIERRFKETLCVWMFNWIYEYCVLFFHLFLIHSPRVHFDLYADCVYWLCAYVRACVHIRSSMLFKCPKRNTHTHTFKVSCTHLYRYMLNAITKEGTHPIIRYLFVI